MSRFRRAAPVSVRSITAGLVGVALFTAIVSATAAGARHQFTIYAKATKVRFVDHSDDRTRGFDKNPFNADTKAILPLMNKKDGKGPLPGDNALYGFKLYRDAGLRKSIGSAVYTCTFNFAHHALCEGTFELIGGSMFAAGPADFDSTSFTIAVTGGTSKYLGVRGEVTAGPAAKDDAHRLDFVLR